MPNEERKPTTDQAMGMAWWNNLSEPQRVRWMAAAGNTGIVADAWLSFKKGVDAEVHQVGADPSALAAFLAKGMTIGRSCLVQASTMRFYLATP